MFTYSIYEYQQNTTVLHNINFITCSNAKTLKTKTLKHGMGEGLKRPSLPLVKVKVFTYYSALYGPLQ